MHLPNDTIGILADNSDAADAETVFPEPSWRALRKAGAPAWSIPADRGGAGWGPHEQLQAHEQLAGACLTTAFLLSQQEAAVRRVCDSHNEKLCCMLLPSLASGETFATVGLSQLTTSRQHQSAALTARRERTEWIFNGVMPWVTGAERADHVIAGAVTEDGRQILAVMPKGMRGLVVGPPLDLMALRGSMTAEVRCEEARLSDEWLIAGPAEKVMATGRGGTGGLETSCLALGLAGAAIDYLAAEVKSRPELAARWKELETARQGVRSDLHRMVDANSSTQGAVELRAKANRLVLGATQTALTVAKGMGFLHSHPAQRWARQALFFLVWSCPRPAAESTLEHLTRIAQGA